MLILNILSLFGLSWQDLSSADKQCFSKDTIWNKFCFTYVCHGTSDSHCGPLSYSILMSINFCYFKGIWQYINTLDKPNQVPLMFVMWLKGYFILPSYVKAIPSLPECQKGNSKIWIYQTFWCRMGIYLPQKPKKLIRVSKDMATLTCLFWEPWKTNCIFEGF